MSGVFIKKVHKCEPPWDTNGLGNGTQWKCDCGQVYEVLGLLGWLTEQEAAQYWAARALDGEQ